MILQKITIENFKIFRSKEINFKDGLNIIMGKNETGKSTILKAIAYLKNNTDFSALNNYNYGLPELPPLIKYHLNPKSLNLNIQEPLIIALTERGYKLFNKGLDNIDLDGIRKKIELKFIKENFPAKSDIDYEKFEPDLKYLSGGELKFRSLNKILEECENSLILIDSPESMLDEEKTKIIYAKLREKSQNNQIILTTRLMDYNNMEDVVIYLTNDLPRYLAEHSRFYQDFLDNIKNIKELMQINPSGELENLFYKIIHVNIITIMETYLSNAFIYTVTNDSNYLKKILDFIHKDKRLDYNKVVKPILDDRKKYVSNYILDNLIFHKTEIVKPMYKHVLGVEYPKKKDFDTIGSAINTRHDIVHRNGKTKDEKDIILTEKDIISLIKCMEYFIKFLNDQIKKS